MPKMPWKRKIGAKKPGGKKGVAMMPKAKIPQYQMPGSRRLFKLDVEIGEWLLRLPDAPSAGKIINDFQISPKEFYERAKYLRPIVVALGKQAVIDLLLEMGRETAEKKGESLE